MLLEGEITLITPVYSEQNQVFYSNKQIMFMYNRKGYAKVVVLTIGPLQDCNVIAHI